MPREPSDAQLRALWDVYCTAKMRARAPTADQYDAVELDIARDEFAEELKKHVAVLGIDKAVVDRYLSRVRH